MPLTAVQAAAIGPSAFSELAVICAIHHMRDFTAMAAALRACGADPALMSIIDKGYPYRHRERVDAWLRLDLGATIIAYPDRADGIAAHLGRAKAAGKRTLVFDDGGYVLPVVLNEMTERVGEIVGVVEQTTSGIRKLDPFPTLPVPVFSVAESALKAAVEAPHVAASVIDAVMELVPDETWAGRTALVLGYGRLGRQAARILRDVHRMRVAVYDKETVLLVTAHQDGFTIDRDLSVLLREHRPLLVMGAAGAGSLAGRHAEDFVLPAYLASMTSRDCEFPLAEWAAVAQRVVDYGELGHGYLMPAGVELCVLGDGLPLNFHRRESMPNRVSDLVFAALLAGGAALAEPGRRGHGPGCDVALVDEILAGSPMLTAYLDIYGDDTGRRLLSPDPAGSPDYRRSPWRYSQALGIPTAERVFPAGDGLLTRFAEHLAVVRGECSASGRPAVPRVFAECPEPPDGTVRIPHLVAVVQDDGRIDDIVIWETMDASNVKEWCGALPDHRWFEERLSDLLAVRRILRGKGLPDTEATRAMRAALAGPYLSIRFAYQHVDLIAAVLADLGSESNGVK
jgi:S-adenosylhomocysteine hydrolase